MADQAVASGFDADKFAGEWLVVARGSVGRDRAFQTERVIFRPFDHNHELELLQKDSDGCDRACHGRCVAETGRKGDLLRVSLLPGHVSFYRIVEVAESGARLRIVDEPSGEWFVLSR